MCVRRSSYSAKGRSSRAARWARSPHPFAAALPDVVAVQTLPSRECGFEEFELHSAQDVSARVPRAIEQAGGCLRMLYPMDVELEDMFLHLTREGGMGHA